jgi:hypothetical protein
LPISCDHPNNMSYMYPQGKTSSTHWPRGWVGPTANLDTSKKEKFLARCESNHNSSVVKTIA